jgi:hypothetical protein
LSQVKAFRAVAPPSGYSDHCDHHYPQAAMPERTNASVGLQADTIALLARIYGMLVGNAGLVSSGLSRITAGCPNYRYSILKKGQTTDGVPATPASWKW